jgi:AAA family ATP:ADP antiporter
VLDRLLRLFGDVRAGEAVTTLLMLANVFLILAGYYVCKTVREPLILAGGGAEVKSYASAGQAIALMGFIPLYSWFASRVNRSRLVIGVTLFFIVNIELFWLGAQLGVPYLGVVFFIWVGIFNNAIVAQFWSYGNDLYRQETGQRLFPVIGIGMTLGAPLGAALTERLFKAHIQAYTMLHITAVILLFSMAIYVVVERRELGRRHEGPPPALESGPNGFALLAQSRYLRLVCLLLVVLNLVNTTGGYILDKSLLSEAAKHAGEAGFDEKSFIGAFYGHYYFWVNIVTALVQALLVSRIVKYFGIAGALLASPIVALGAYGSVLAGATLAIIQWAKTADNAADYSIMNTARQLLWLPTTREEKYKAKQAADTFIVRIGDMLSAGLVFAGSTWLGLGLHGFAGANIVLVAMWIAVAVLVLRENRALIATKAA